MFSNQGLKTGLRLANSALSKRPIHSTCSKLNANPTLAKIIEQSTTNKELVSGAPSELAEANNRLVRIYKESKYATQSSSLNSKFWKIEWDVLSKGNRWENDLIGYQGTSDYMHATRLNFDSKEQAVNFAKGHGWDYYIQEPKVRKFKPKEYSSNFYHIKGPLKHIRTK